MAKILPNPSLPPAAEQPATAPPAAPQLPGTAAREAALAALTKLLTQSVMALVAPDLGAAIEAAIASGATETAILQASGGAAPGRSAQYQMVSGYLAARQRAAATAGR